MKQKSWYVAVRKAWQDAQDAWVAAGKTIPCYDPKYLAARKKLADVYEACGVTG